MMAPRSMPGMSIMRARAAYGGVMTYANVGTLGAVPGQRDQLVAILTRRTAELTDAGCLLYEVGVNDEQPDTVFVVELWTSADAHSGSLQLPSVQAAIAEARPLLSGEMGGFRFDIIGSPVRD
jgi:quinol monooxygenase YgiN